MGRRNKVYRRGTFASRYQEAVRVAQIVKPQEPFTKFLRRMEHLDREAAVLNERVKRVLQT